MKKTMTRILTFALMAVLAFLLKLPAQASDITAFAPVFNASYYLEANPDLKAVLGNDATLLYHHFLTSGMSEGRQGSAEFNVHIYKENNADLKAVFGEEFLGSAYGYGVTAEEHCHSVCAFCGKFYVVSDGYHGNSVC